MPGSKREVFTDEILYADLNRLDLDKPESQLILIKLFNSDVRVRAEFFGISPKNSGVVENSNAGAKTKVQFAAKLWRKLHDDKDFAYSFFARCDVPMGYGTVSTDILTILALNNPGAALGILINPTLREKLFSRLKTDDVIVLLQQAAGENDEKKIHYFPMTLDLLLDRPGNVDNSNVTEGIVKVLTDDSEESKPVQEIIYSKKIRPDINRVLEVHADVFVGIINKGTPSNELKEMNKNKSNLKEHIDSGYIQKNKTLPDDAAFAIANNSALWAQLDPVKRDPVKSMFKKLAPRFLFDIIFGEEVEAEKVKLKNLNPEIFGKKLDGKIPFPALPKTQPQVQQAAQPNSAIDPQDDESQYSAPTPISSPKLMSETLSPFPESPKLMSETLSPFPESPKLMSETLSPSSPKHYSETDSDSLATHSSPALDKFATATYLNENGTKQQESKEIEMSPSKLRPGSKERSNFWRDGKSKKTQEDKSQNNEIQSVVKQLNFTNQ